MLKFFIILVLFFLISIFFVWKNNSLTQKSIQTTESYEVELSAEGFKPESLVVKKGATVVFVNSKGGAFWPASDPHPAHTNYSEFDSKQAIPNGESWSYKFDRVGSWTFHDHLSPYFIGKIIVVENDGNSGELSSNCKLNPNTKACWDEALTLTLNKKGLTKVLDEVSILYESKPEFADSCHDIMHSMGHKAYKNYLQDEDSVVNPKAFYCANGFYHGFMASFLNSNQDLDKAKEFCAFIGKELGKKAPDSMLQCYHGIGHGLLEEGFQKGKPFTSEQDLAESALSNCEKVSETEQQLYRCTSGIFNGIANFYISGERNFKLNSKEPFSFCENQVEKYKKSCYGNFNSVIFWVAKNDLKLASKFIIEMKDKKYQESSIRYLSALSTLKLAKVDPEKAILTCRETGKLNLSCIQGFAHGFLEHGNPNKEWEGAVNFCTNKMLTEVESDTCLRYALGGLTSWYSEIKSKEICDSVELRFQKYCKKS